MKHTNERIELDAEWHIHHLKTPYQTAMVLVHTSCEPVDSTWDEKLEDNMNGKDGSCMAGEPVCAACKTVASDSIYMKFATYFFAVGSDCVTERDRKYLAIVRERLKHE